MTDISNILIYIALWAITFIYFLKKKRCFGAGNFILLTYLIYAILAYFLYVVQYKKLGFDNLELFPFIYLYLMMMLALLPVLKYDERYEIIQPNLKFLDTFVIIYIVASAFIIPSLFFDISDALFIIFSTESGGEELYYLSHLNSIKETDSFGLINVVKIIFNVFSDIVVFIFFYNLTLERKNKILIVFLLSAILISTLRSLADGGRTGITMRLLLFLSSYFLFKEHLSSFTKRLLSISGVFFVVIALFFLIIIGKSRFGAKIEYDDNYQLLNYTGMAPLQFNKYAFNSDIIRYGDRTCSGFKKLLLFEKVPQNYEECRKKYPNMKLDDSKFSTFVGDFTLDFGPVGAAILFILFTCAILQLTRRKGNRIAFHKLLLVFMVMSICVQGGMYLFYYSFKGNYTIIAYFLLYIIFKNNPKVNNGLSLRK